MEEPEIVEVELLDCPFCGGTPIARNYGIGKCGVMIGCDCGVLMTAGRHSKHEDIMKIHEDLKEQTITYPVE